MNSASLNAMYEGIIAELRDDMQVGASHVEGNSRLRGRCDETVEADGSLDLDSMMYIDEKLVAEELRQEMRDVGNE